MKWLIHTLYFNTQCGAFCYISKINTNFIACCIYNLQIVRYNNNYRNEYVCFLYFVELSLFYQVQKKNLQTVIALLSASSAALSSDHRECVLSSEELILASDCMAPQLQHCSHIMYPYNIAPENITLG